MEPTKDDENEVLRWALGQIANSVYGQIPLPPMTLAEFVDLALRFSRADMKHRGEAVRYRFEKWLEEQA